MERRKGFTLAELLATILILSLVAGITVAIVMLNVDRTKDNIDEVVKNEIITSSKGYVLENRNSDFWKEYTSKEGLGARFCVSIKALVEKGYFKNNVDTIMKYANDNIIEVTIDSDGVYNYNLVNSDIANCEYVNGYTEVANGSSDTIGIGDDNSPEAGTLDYIITKNTDSRYVMNLNFDLNIGNMSLDKVSPYVIVVADASGSMSGRRWNNVVSAVKKFSTTLLEEDSETQIAVIEFGMKPSGGGKSFIVREFKNEIVELSKNDASQGRYSTLSGGLDIAIAYYNSIEKPADSLLYVITLADGEPNRYLYYKDASNNNISNSSEGYYDGLMESVNNNKVYENTGATSQQIKTHIIDASNKVKSYENNRLIFIGYEFDAKKSYLGTIASTDNELCKDSSYEGYCYYDSKADSIDNLFGKLSKNIITVNRNISANKATIILKQINKKYFTVKDKYGNEYDGDIEIPIQLDDVTPDKDGNMIVKLDENYQIVLNDSVIDECTKDINSCPSELEIFDMKIVLDYEDKESKEIVFDKSPKINVRQQLINITN